ncbi:beta-2 adrenergic receptor-like [Ptychodera flava]|uniref:beta-2 adrenergic receptor-like n=1 Tax=Ptychodera flava TaxID=63121 RepID=UPI00396A6E3D
MAANISDGVADPSSAGDSAYFVYYYTTLITLTLINICGNSLVIVSVATFRTLRNVSNYFITSLSCSDILLGIFYTLYNLSHMEVPAMQVIGSNWIFCDFMIAFFEGLFYCSSFNLVAITIVRYIAVTDPVGYATKLTKRKTVYAIIAIWIGSMLFSGILFIRPQPATFKGSCRYELISPVWHLMVMLTFMVLVPWVIMVALYVRIWMIARERIWKNAKRQNQVAPSGTAGNGQEDREKNAHLYKKEMKATKMVALVLGYYILAWAPLMIFLFIGLSCKTCFIDRYIRATVRLLLHSNSAVNVFIYAGSSPEFKRAFKQTLCRIVCCCTRPPTFGGNNVPLTSCSGSAS